jgi:hypothetical protein
VKQLTASKKSNGEDGANPSHASRNISDAPNGSDANSDSDESESLKDNRRIVVDTVSDSADGSMSSADGSMSSREDREVAPKHEEKDSSNVGKLKRKCEEQETGRSKVSS